MGALHPAAFGARLCPHAASARQQSRVDAVVEQCNATEIKLRQRFGELLQRHGLSQQRQNAILQDAAETARQTGRRDHVAVARLTLNVCLAELQSTERSMRVVGQQINAVGTVRDTALTLTATASQAELLKGLATAARRGKWSASASGVLKDIIASVGGEIEAFTDNVTDATDELQGVADGVAVADDTSAADMLDAAIADALRGDELERAPPLPRRPAETAGAATPDTFSAVDAALDVPASRRRREVAHA